MAEITQTTHGYIIPLKYRDIFQKYFFLVPALLLLVGLMVYPLFYAIQTSFSTFNTTTFQPGNFVGFKNYIRVLNDPHFWTSLKVTALYMVIAIPVQLIIGIMIAYIISVDWPGSKIVRALFLIPMVITPVVVGSTWKMLLDPLWGQYNQIIVALGGSPIHWLGNPKLALLSIIMIDTWRETPFVILIVQAGIASMDQEPLEAAKVDGANLFQRIMLVEIPMMRDVILSALIIRWLIAIKMFDIIFTTTRGGPGNTTEVTNMFIYDSAFRTLSFEKSSAMSILIVIVAMTFTIIILRASNRRAEE